MRTTRRSFKASFLTVGLLLFTCVLFGSTSSASAKTINEYRNNLQRAVTALDTLGQLDENEDAESYRQRLIQTIDGVRNAIPEKQSIEVNGSTVEVDNAALHKMLRQLATAPDADREVLRLQVIDSLRSIEERVVELEEANVKDSLSKDAANKKLTEILTRPEYATTGKKESALYRLLQRFILWILQFLPQRSPSRARGNLLTTIAQVLVVALAAAVIVFVLIKLIRHFGRRSRKTKTKKRREPRIVLGEKLEPEESATDLLADAESLARTGQIRAAIRKAYIALLVELGDRKVISLAQHKTNRDYLRAVSGLPSLYRNMSGLTNSFERHWYGFAETAPADWQDFKSAYLATLKAND